MTAKLFSPITFKEVTLKNRIVMSPMCMYSSEQEDGTVQPFHVAHYESRAAGQIGLVMVEATAVQSSGRISSKDLGIWNDSQIEGLKAISDRVHAHDAKSGIQLAHAGRKAVLEEETFAPSALAFNETYKTPTAMTKEDINDTIKAFQLGAKRANEAGFDIIELHGAHGYLINQFLSPLTNKRDDEYGGSRVNRYRILSEIIDAVKIEWDGPIFVRISANEYDENGNSVEDFVYFSFEMKKQGIDLIDCSSGGVVPAKITPFPGYQLPRAEKIKKEVEIATGAVGLITSGIQAEEIIQNERADLVFLARALLRNPYWAKYAADELGYSLESITQYRRGWQ
ncbi:NADPH dehydrogenase NamA [Aquibacillus sp. 3ASR75-11]|uniref:NADPH dehydrogenase NamA n=1 Tax=Terrihalobacillus insolitus TaxID=2950438 RepID=A0A9X4APA5_9BACI|nr:NADPH dehydrogenase NamA [Terrihalobacillus insolitus]MDC3414470.1 NADPH dehydrogenase NamA [Terrihalobacillus insolitus]MDC3425350.1 NADPH dehydrogenase NamA [Terrihalobacillus insolitus]